MDHLLLDFSLYIGIMSLLGMLYYFYQKRKILKFEENKISLVMNYIFRTCLADKLDMAQPDLDQVIEALDDFLNGHSPNPPILLLNNFAHSLNCSQNLKEAILEGLKELE